MAFTVPSFDELLNAILTDYINQFPGSDTAKGSMIYIKSAAIASAFWGLYQHQRWISDQIFPDTSSTEALEHHAYVRGLTRKPAETDADLLARLLDYLRRPPAGGNQYDYVKWALSITGVKAVYCIPLGQGLGTVDVIIVADNILTGSSIPTQELLDEVKAYIDTVRPVTVKYVRALAPTIVTQDVSITLSGAGLDYAAIATAITAYIDDLEPGQTLYLSQLTSICVSAGAVDVVIHTPLANVPCLATTIIRAGVISVA